MRIHVVLLDAFLFFNVCHVKLSHCVTLPSKLVGAISWALADGYPIIRLSGIRSLPPLFRFFPMPLSSFYVCPMQMVLFHFYKAFAPEEMKRHQNPMHLDVCMIQAEGKEEVDTYSENQRNKAQTKSLGLLVAHLRARWTGQDVA